MDEADLRLRAKAELRKRARALRSATPESACLIRSQRIVATLKDHPAVAAARSISLFWPIVERHEVDLRSLDKELRGRGVTIFYPSIDPETDRMTFREASPEVLEKRGLGFAEPDATAREASSLDVIIVPALAADERGHRLGYGRGYYDKTLPRFAPPAITIAVVFDFQLLAEVPATTQDVPVRFVVTDTRTLTTP